MQSKMHKKNLESRNFDSRKHVLQYDEVMNEQRKIIYAQRQCADVRYSVLSRI